MVSDSPPLFPGNHTEYISAVSIKSNPASTYLSNISKEAFSSAVHPNTLHPKAKGITSKSDFPIFLFNPISKSFKYYIIKNQLSLKHITPMFQITFGSIPNFVYSS